MAPDTNRGVAAGRTTYEGGNDVGRKKSTLIQNEIADAHDADVHDDEAIESSAFNDPDNSDLDDVTPENEKNSISKSQRKRDMLALQDIGRELTDLSRDVVKQLELPEEIRDAVLDLQRIPNSKHGGYKRQMQYIGRLMREIDAAPIIAQLEALKAPNKKQTAQHHLAERWRDRLLTDATALGAFAREFESADTSQLEKLIAAAKDDHAKQRPPKNFRLLYQTIHKQIVAKS
jgi:ribosome-associated protein